MLLARFPQKSAVKTSNLKTAIMVTMKAKIGTSLQIMTTVLTMEASSTPRLTSHTISQLMADMSTTPGMASAPEKAGTK